MDKQGYPTDEELEIIKHLDGKDFDADVEKIQALWIYPESIYTTVEADLDGDDITVLNVSTGGWSGHEDVIDALQSNHLWWALYWLESRRGGHYKFERRVYAQKNN